MNIFDGVAPISWGFDAADIWTNAMFIVGSLAIFVLLGLSMGYVPRIIEMIKTAAAARRSR